MSVMLLRLSESTLSTSNWEEEEVFAQRPQDQVLNPPLELLQETVSELVESRMLPQLQLIPPEEPVVEEVEDSEFSFLSR